MNNPLISVVILNWNGMKVIDGCLRSLEKQTYKNLEVIVVDNASKDGSNEYIAKAYPRVKLISNKSNLGFGGGNNVGISAAKGEYVMMLNNDTRIEPDCVEQLKTAIEKNRNYGACASKILLEFDRDLHDVAGIAVCLDGLSIGRGRVEHKDKFNEEEEVFFASDCACLYRKEMLEDIKVGEEFYDEDFFAYADETDMGWRAQLAGWKCIYNPKAVVYHFHSASTSTYSSFKAFLVERNRIWVGIKSFPLPFLIRGIGYTMVRYSYQVYGALTGKGAAGKFTKQATKSELGKILIKAFLSAAAGLPKMLRKRKVILGKKRITDRDISVLFRRFGMSARAIAFKD
jgi:GT2 family glycosyltransferase